MNFGVYMWLGCFGLGQPADGQHGDVVFLTEVFGRFGYVEGGLVAQIVNAVEAEDFAGGTPGFDHSIGEEQNAVAGVQVEAHFFIMHFGQDAQGQRAGQGDLLAVEIGRQVSGVGDAPVRRWRQTRRPGRW